MYTFFHKNHMVEQFVNLTLSDTDQYLRQANAVG